MKIVYKKILADTQDTKITKIVVDSPEIAQKARPGEFVVLMATEKGERIPLTVVSTEPSAGLVTLIFQELGFSTKLLGEFNKGDSLFAIVGPFGHPTEIKNYGKVIVVGGGVGIAVISPVARALKEAGNNVTSILGARNKELLILESEMKEYSDNIFITTDDGSYGQKGFVTDVLKKLLDESKYDIVYAVGPIPMMEMVSNVTKDFNVKTVVSLNSLMVDATGMCGGCRVTIGGEVKFTCVDGPEFDGHLVDWNNLKKRSRVYKEREGHICNLKK
ncbi:MAG: sulfide/dihydroorotate dehydrogenase-like FAD/NAD-binding protein [Candidatus Omnitrophota bacterium]